MVTNAMATTTSPAQGESSHLRPRVLSNLSVQRFSEVKASTCPAGWAPAFSGLAHAIAHFLRRQHRQKSTAWCPILSGVYPTGRGGSGVVSAGSGRAAAAGPIGMEELAARLVHPLVRMRAEIIALRLQQIRRQHGVAILIVKRQRRAERRHRNALLRRRRHDVAPALLAALDFAAEIIIEQQIREPG